jgi:hypothetical protein
VANRTVNGIYKPLRFKLGDYFGFTSVEQDAVGYNFGGNVKGSRTLFRKLDKFSIPKRGDNYEVNIKFLVYKFSLSVTYATHVDLCKLIFSDEQFLEILLNVMRQVVPLVAADDSMLHVYRVSAKYFQN